MASSRCLREAPWFQLFGLILPTALVATMYCERRLAPCARNQRPTISSVRPAVSSVPPRGYTSAVSMKLMPPSVARSRILVRHGFIGLQAEGHGAEREARHGQAGAAEAGGGGRGG